MAIGFVEAVASWRCVTGRYESGLEGKGHEVIISKRVAFFSHPVIRKHCNTPFLIWHGRQVESSRKNVTKQPAYLQNKKLCLLQYHCDFPHYIYVDISRKNNEGTKYFRFRVCCMYKEFFKKN